MLKYSSELINSIIIHIVKQRINPNSSIIQDETIFEITPRRTSK